MREIHYGRPTTYRGTPMRSRLEATAAALFDHYGLDWEYEPMCFASPAGQYLPDFRVTGLVDTCDDDRCHVKSPPTYVEVKPDPLVTKTILRRCEIVWESLPEARLLVLDPREEFLSWAAPFADDGTGNIWSTGFMRPECYWCFDDDGNITGFGQRCGALHFSHDATALHVPPGGWDCPPGFRR